MDELKFGLVGRLKPEDFEVTRKRGRYDELLKAVGDLKLIQSIELDNADKTLYPRIVSAVRKVYKNVGVYKTIKGKLCIQLRDGEKKAEKWPILKGG